MLTSLLLASLLSSSVPGESAGWSVLTSSPVRVECATVNGAPWCRSFGVIHAPIDQVSGALRDMRYNASLFSSIVKIDVLDSETIRVVLDYPSPLADRDYVAHYSYATDGDAQIYTWVPVVHPAAPETSEAVRLPNMAGEWRLEPRGDTTWVRYTWQAEIQGDFPSIGYSTARKRAGYEALKDLAATQKATLTAQ